MNHRRTESGSLWPVSTLRLVTAAVVLAVASGAAAPHAAQELSAESPH